MLNNKLWSGGPALAINENVFPVTADSILLADFASSSAADAKHILDIGCGCGIIGLLLAWNNKDAFVTAVDISPEAVACTRENFEQNGLTECFEVICGDILDLDDRLFDLIVCNPPYFEKGRGKSGGAAREESAATLGDIIAHSAKLLCTGGVLCLVLRPERLPEALESLTENELSPARLRLVRHTEESPPSMALIEAFLSSSVELDVLPPLILKNKNGGDSEDVKRIYRMI